MNTRHLPHAPILGDVGYYIQRGATLQTYRLLSSQGGNLAASIAQVIDTLIAVPFVVGLSARLDRIAFSVQTLAAGSSARVGIYRATSSKNIYPAGLVVDSGAISTATAGFKEAVIDTPLAPGLYWAAYVAGVLAPSVRSQPAPQERILGWTNADPPVDQKSVRIAFAFAALPATFPGEGVLSPTGAVAIFGRFSA